MSKKAVLLFIVFVLFSSVYCIPAASSWDGVCHAIKDYLKENAHDPKSIKYVQCSYILELDIGIYAQTVKFRGKNAFGGTILNEYVFYIAGEKYNAVVVTTGTKEELSLHLATGEVKIVAKYNWDGTKQ